jgi:hypothetical protein
MKHLLIQSIMAIGFPFAIVPAAAHTYVDLVNMLYEPLRYSDHDVYTAEIGRLKHHISTHIMFLKILISFYSNSILLSF